MTKRDWLTLGQLALLFIQIGVTLSALLKPIHVQTSCPPTPCCCDDADGGTDGGGQ